MIIDIGGGREGEWKGQRGKGGGEEGGWKAGRPRVGERERAGREY